MFHTFIGFNLHFTYSIFLDFYGIQKRSQAQIYIFKFQAKTALEELGGQLENLEKQTKYRDTVFTIRLILIQDHHNSLSMSRS